MELPAKNDLVKILNKGELKTKINITAHKFSATAKAAIEALGGVCKSNYFCNPLDEKIYSKYKNIWKVTELRKRIILTLTLILIYRIGSL